MDRNSGLQAPHLVLLSVGRPEAWTGMEADVGEPVGGETREWRQAACPGRGAGRRGRGKGRCSDLECEWDLTSRDADGTTALFALSGQPVIGLELTVTNLPSDPAQPQADGDDAHEAQLLVTLPASLHYSGVRALDPAVRACGRVGWGVGGSSNPD